MPRARVVRDYRAQYANPIRFASGNVVVVGKRDDEWTDFIWATTPDGNSGWAPNDWLKPLGDGSAQALEDYSARELDVVLDEVVVVLREYGGWCWVANADGSVGWVPGSCVRIDDDVVAPEYSAAEIATAWIAFHANGGHDAVDAEPYGWAEVEVDWLERNDPETLWQVILDIYPRPEARAHLGLLAAGALEDLLGLHGPAFIDRVESLARRNPLFAHVLGGVWQFTMTDDVWSRVQAVQDTSGWDDRAA